MARISKKEKERRRKISESLKRRHAEAREAAKRRSKAAKKAAETRRRKKEATYHKPPPEPKKAPKRKRKVPSPVTPEPSHWPERPKTKRPKKVRKPKKEVVLEEIVPEKKESFTEKVKREASDAWKGPWNESPPSREESEYALAEIFRISNEVAEGLSSEKVRDELGLKHPVNAWGLTPVINSDLTVSGEVRFEVPAGRDYMAVVQYLQSFLPKPEIGNIWLTPVVDYEPRGRDKDSAFTALAQSPFEPIRGGAYVRAFSVKYDEDISVKAVTGFAKAQEMADKIDPQQRFIKPVVVRIKLKWQERPPRSTYELRRMEERAAAEEAKRRIIEGEGFEPIN